MNFLDYLIAGFAMMFVIEGLFYAIFTTQIQTVLAELAKQRTEQLRYLGVGFMAIGVFIVWLTKP